MSQVKKFSLYNSEGNKPDWSKADRYPYERDNRDKIKNPDGETPKQEITSIPSPFARIELVKNAFKEVTERGLDGDTIFHKMVSDTLDIGEIFFNIDRFSDKVEILTWNPEENFANLKKSVYPGHKYLGDALEKYFDSDAKVYNFNKQENIYILNKKIGPNEKVNVLGATSPATLFFSNANDLSKCSEDLSFENYKPFSSSFTPLYKRDFEYVKALFYYKNKYGNEFASDFPELTEYLEKTHRELNEDQRKAIRENCEMEDVYPTISVSGRQDNRVEVHGQPIYKTRGCSIDESDFLINSSLLPDEKILVLPVEVGNTYKDLKYVKYPWGTQNQAPYFDRTQIEERTLPFIHEKHPYLTISDFLEPYIIRVPYKLNEDEFYTAHERRNNEVATFLLPLKPLFFKYFSREEILEKQMITISTISESSAEVTLKIPIRSKKQQNSIIYTRTYSSDVPEESNNKGAVITMTVAGFVMPNIRFQRQEEAIYKIGFLTKEINRYRLQFYQGNSIIPNIIPSIREVDDANIRNAVYTIREEDFDYIRITQDGTVSSIIIPKFRTQRTNNEFKFSVDLGTSNTHIEVSKNGGPSEAYSYTKSPLSKFFVQTLDAKGGVKDLKFENDIMEKDLLPNVVGKSSDFHFPTRTILSYAKCIDWRVNLNCFEMHNIPLTYGKRLEKSYNKYEYNIKWGTTKKDNDLLKCYIEDLLFMLRLKVILGEGDPASTKLTWFYPISMSPGRKAKLVNIWKEKFAEFFPGTDDTSIEPMSESYAPMLYYRNEDATVSNLINIDIGGGTTDVAYFADRELAFVTSFKFAANDIFQDAFANGSVQNAIVDAYKNDIKRILEAKSSDQEVKDILQIFDSENNRKPANMASFLFSLRNNQALKDKVNLDRIDFNKLLQNDQKFKIVFIIFYSAIIYHIAKIVRLKRLPLPRHVSLSGNGSKVIKIVSSDSSILSAYTKRLFEDVVGLKFENTPLNIIGLDQEDSKEVTCKGGILDSEPSGNTEKQVILKSTGDQLLGKVTFRSIDANFKKEVEHGTKDFFDYFFTLCSKYNMKDAFDVANGSINIAKRLCSRDIGTFINRGLESQRKDYEESDPLRETLFFYPMKGYLSNLIKELNQK